MSSRVLLAAVTGEPFQPVRLYYSIPNQEGIARAFKRLQCMDEDRKAKCWVWLYEHEAAGLTFKTPRADLPPEVHPIVIGRFRMPKGKNELVLEVRSAERAIEAAKFFGPIFGDCGILGRLRIINRWFEFREAAFGLEKLDRLLDANVIRIDPMETEAAILKAVAGGRTREDKHRAFGDFMAEQVRADVPLVEDFPLCPEEETPDFFDLTMTLTLRSLRAFEHWEGNTKVTLGDVIKRQVAKGELAFLQTVPGGKARR